MRAEGTLVTVTVNGVVTATADLPGVAPAGRVRLWLGRDGSEATGVEYRSIRVRGLDTGVSSESSAGDELTDDVSPEALAAAAPREAAGRERAMGAVYRSWHWRTWTCAANPTARGKPCIFTTG